MWVHTLNTYNMICNHIIHQTCHVITKYEFVKYVFDTNTSYKNSQGTMIMVLYCKLLSGNDNVI